MLSGNYANAEQGLSSTSAVVDTGRLAQLVLQAPPAGALKNGASCPHSVVICLVPVQQYAALTGL